MPTIKERIRGKKWAGDPKRTPLDRLHQSQADRRNRAERITARFHGGPLNGQELAIPPGPVPRTWEVMVSNPPTVYMGYPNAPEVAVYSTSAYTNVQTWWTEDSTASVTFAANNTISTTGVWDGTAWNIPIQYVDNFTTGTITVPSFLQTPAPVISQEEADRRLAETRARMHRDAIRRKAAVKKGRRLLVSMLSDVQARQYAESGMFTVYGKDGKVYRLRKRGTVHELFDGEPIRSHCIHLPYSYIEEDTLIAIKLLLENDPKEFLKIANTTNLIPQRLVVPDAPSVQIMTERANAVAAGMNAVNERFAAIARAAERAREAADSLGRAIEYADYARGLEQQVVAEETGGLALPLQARQVRCAQAFGHDQTIAGELVPALAA